MTALVIGCSSSQCCHMGVDKDSSVLCKLQVATQRLQAGHTLIDIQAVQLGMAKLRSVCVGLTEVD